MTITSMRVARAAGLTWALTCASTLAGAAPAAGGGIRQLEGEAFAPASGRLMYRETHWRFEQHGEPARLVLYRCPDGDAFARKLSHVTGRPQAPDFQLDDGRTGYREGVRHHGDTRQVFIRRSGTSVEKSAPLDTSPLPVIDAGFDAYIRSHWDSLGRGGTDTVPFVLPSRLDTMNFRVARMDDTTVGGRKARLYRLSVASWIGFALPHIDVAYDADTRDLLRFVGPANIQRSGGGDNVRARIMFDPANEHASSAAELDAARHVPLDGHCPIP